MAKSSSGLKYDGVHEAVRVSLFHSFSLGEWTATAIRQLLAYCFACDRASRRPWGKNNSRSKQLVTVSIPRQPARPSSPSSGDMFPANKHLCMLLR